MPAGSTRVAYADFIPRNVGNCWAWYRSDLGIEQNGTVSKWIDQSGNGFDVTQPTPANQPTFNKSDSSYNGCPTVQSTNASSQINQTYLTIGAPIIKVAPLTMYYVGEHTTAGGSIVLGGHSANPAEVFLNGGVITSNAGLSISSSLSAASKRAVCAVFNSTQSFLGVDDWTNGTTADAGTFGITQGLGLFSADNGNFGTIGKLAEVIIFAAAHDAATRALIGRYFSSRYGVNVR